MRIIVQKYGGSSLADTEKIKKIAQKIVHEREQGFNVLVVVSAMGSTTNHLVEMAHEINPDPARRELDMLVTVGERISMALLSMAIQSLGHPAISFTGSQSGIITNASHTHARIIEIRPFRLLDELERGKIVIIAGFQGMSYNREITSLGRGGSDTTAVAMAAALDAERCDIYSDVDGVYSADPRVVLSARKLDKISYEEMMLLAKHGAVVLNADAVEFARRRGIALYTRASFGKDASGGTIIRRGQMTGDHVVSAVTHKNVWLVRWEGKAPGGPNLTAWTVEFGATVDYLIQDSDSTGLMVLDTSNLVCPKEQLFDLLVKKVKNAGIIRDLAMITVIGEGVLRPDVYECFMKHADDSVLTLATPLSLSVLVNRDKSPDLLIAIHENCVEIVPTPEEKIKKSEKI